MHFFLCIDLEIFLDEGNVRDIESTILAGNSYNLWHVQAPSGYVVSVTITEYVTGVLDGKYTYIYFGDNTSTFSTDKGAHSCFSWTRLTDPEGHLAYGKFGSKGSWITLFAASATSNLSFSISLQAIQVRCKLLYLKKNNH